MQIFFFVGLFIPSDIYTGNVDVNTGNAFAVTLKAVWTDNYGSMQEFSCSSLAVGQTTTLRDLRDEDLYTAFKSPSGACWMSQDLRIVGPKTLTSVDSDVASDFELAAPLALWPSGTDATWYHRNNSLVGPSTEPAPYGSHYNYYSASAGTVFGDSDSNPTEHSICPKGWKLPSKAEWDVLFYDYNITNNATGSLIARSDPINIVYSGAHGAGSTIYDVGVNNHLWTATPSANAPETTRSSIFFSNTQAVLGGTGRQGGRTIRCIAR